MSEKNPNTRLEAFCDGVFAIALTLLIIDIKIPPAREMHSTTEFWQVLHHMTPSVLAFVLSFAIILITWVNHHHALKLVNRSSTSFIYANGLLLLTVVFLPFPTSLLGEYILTDHSAPAVVLYNATIALQSVGWILMCTAALRGQLNKNEKSAAELRKNRMYGYFSVVTYTLFSVAALWFPLTIAVTTVLLWIFWLFVGMAIKHAEAA